MIQNQSHQNSDTWELIEISQCISTRRYTEARKLIDQLRAAINSRERQGTLELSALKLLSYFDERLSKKRN
jgi:hypothetical protein